MKTLQAAWATVHEFAEGTEVLAREIGIKSKQVLINKVGTNPNKAHHLTLSEAERIIKFTGDVRIIHALAEEMGGIYVPSPANGDARSTAVISDISNMSQEFGLLIREVAKDIEDGVITSNELKKIESAANKLRVALATLISDLVAIHKASVPKTSNEK